LAEKAVLSTIRNIKEHIQTLIHLSQPEDAKRLLAEYEQIMSDDIEIYSMQSIICIQENRMDEAERHLLLGLEVEPDNFDLLFNLAYVHETVGNIAQAYICYRKARSLVYYDTSLRDEVEQALARLQEGDSYKKSELLEQLLQVDQVLLIDFNLSSSTHLLAEQLSDLGVNVDLADWGRIQPTEQVRLKGYRKQLHFFSIDEIMEYASNYAYDVIHVINATEKVKMHLSKNYSYPFLFTTKELLNSANQLLEMYAEEAVIESAGQKFKKTISTDWPITIVIPTYNRPVYLERVICAFNRYQNKSFEVYVLDSSKEEIKMRNREMIASLNDINVRYFDFDSRIDVFEKLNSGIQAVNTPFICLCADDDFLTEEGIDKSLQALMGDPSLFSVKGKNLYFVDKMSKLVEYDFFRGLYEDDALTRIEQITGGFVPSLMYQVFKTKDFKKLYGFFSSNKNDLPNNPIFREYLFYFMVMVTGKVGKISIDLNVRDKGAERETEFKNFPHAIMNGTFNDDYILFRDVLRNYCDSSKLNIRGFDHIFQGLFSKFLIHFIGVPKQYVLFENGKYDLKKMEIGMRKSWVWPANL